MKAILGIEREMGRKRVQNKGPRSIDIDILLFGETVVDSNEVTIPHPAMPQRRFVLEPLAEKTAASFVESEVDPILDKISAHGIQSLTPRERDILETARKKIGRP